MRLLTVLFLVTPLASASETALAPDAAAKKAAFQLAQTAKSTDFAGFTSYYADVACSSYLHAAVGLTVEDAGYKTLYVIVTVPSTRGGFTTLTMTDDEANGSIDTVNTIKLGDLTASVPYTSFSAVLNCYVATK